MRRKNSGPRADPLDKYFLLLTFSDGGLYMYTIVLSMKYLKHFMSVVKVALEPF